MYGFPPLLLGVASSECAHFRADGVLSCDKLSPANDILIREKHWSPKGNAEAQENERIQALFGDKPWLNHSRCQSWCLDRNVLVLGDSVDVQLFHAIEHATAAGRASRAYLPGGGEWAAGVPRLWKGDESVVVRLAGGAIVFCRDNAFWSLDGGNATGTGRGLDHPCAAWRGHAGREIFGVRVDVVVFGDDARYTRSRIEDKAYIGDLDQRAHRLERRIRAVRDAGAEPVIRGIPPTNLLWDGARRPINSRMRQVARDSRAAYVNLERFGEAVIEHAARRSNVSAAYAFVEIARPLHSLGGACPKPLSYPAAPRLEATFADVPLPRATYPDYKSRPICPAGSPIMADGTHWMPHVYAFWGQIAARAIARAEDPPNATLKRRP